MTERERTLHLLYKASRSKKPFDKWRREYEATWSEIERNRTIGDFERGELEPQGRMQ